MSNASRMVAIIPARKGSKRLPGKNTRILCGKPLVQWSIEAAQASAAVDRVLVTSDDPDVLAIAAELGVDFVVSRPEWLADDTAKTSDVIRHAIDHLAAQGCRPEAICLLQPTSPLRAASDVDAAFRRYAESGGRSVVSVCEVDHPIAWCARLDETGSMSDFARKLKEEKRSQDHEAYFRLNGAIYISSATNFLETGGFLDETALAYIMPRERSVDIDSALDLLVAQVMLGNRLDGRDGTF